MCINLKTYKIINIYVYIYNHRGARAEKKYVYIYIHLYTYYIILWYIILIYWRQIKKKHYRLIFINRHVQGHFYKRIRSHFWLCAPHDRNMSLVSWRHVISKNSTSFGFCACQAVSKSFSLRAGLLPPHCVHPKATVKLFGMAISRQQRNSWQGMILMSLW